MNRFRKEEIAAAKAALTVPATPFSWSVSRHLLFHRCRRACFLHYYFAQGGWDPYADPLVRFTWNVKKTLTYRERLEHHLEEILRHSLDTIRNVPAAFRMKMLEIRLFAKLRELEEYWDRGGNMSSVEKDLLRDLKIILGDFLVSESCAVIAATQNPSRFNKAFKPSFYLNGTELWYNPGLIWNEGRTLVSLRLHSSRPDPAFVRAESDMFALSAKIHTGCTETLSIFRYPESSRNWKDIQREGDPFECERRIESDKKEMLGLIRGEEACMLDFPPCGEDDCFGCRYETVCAAVAEQFGDF